MAIKRTSARIIVLAATIACGWVAPSLHAQKLVEDPVELVNLVVEQVVADIQANEQHYRQNPARLREMVHSRITPYFATQRITQLILGKHYRTASEQQREVLAEEFQALIVRSYADALLKAPQAQVEFKSRRDTGPNSALLKLKVVSPRGNSMTVDLRMEKREAGWQVIDVMIDGVSLVITYRAAFDAEIQQSGIDGLIASLRQKSSIENL